MYSTGGHISHVYSEHPSFVKFVERNWKLGERLTDRSRDNLPTRCRARAIPMSRRNMPAIGDLFDLFQFNPSFAAHGSGP